jgi:hypothetical protein
MEQYSKTLYAFKKFSKAALGRLLRKWRFKLCLELKKITEIASSHCWQKFQQVLKENSKNFGKNIKT